MPAHKARSKTGGLETFCVSARKPRCKSRILFSRRLPGLPHCPMAETTFKGVALRLLSAEPLWSLRSVSGTALVSQRLATVVAARSFFGIELDRFHRSTFAFVAAVRALISSTPPQGDLARGGRSSATYHPQVSNVMDFLTESPRAPMCWGTARSKKKRTAGRNNFA